MVSFTKLRFQPGHFHRWYGITNIYLFWPRMVQTPQMMILQVHIRSKNTCCLVASLWKWAFRYDNGLVSTGWQTVFVSSAIHSSDDWIHKQKYSALSISRGHVSHYRDVLMSAMVPQITSMVPFYDVIMSEDHPIAGPYGRDMDVPREFKVGFDVCCIQYTVTFDRDISIIYSSAFSAFSLDFFPVIQHIFPFIVRRAGLLLSQQDFEWRWSVPLFQCLTVLEFSFILFDLCLLITFFNFIMNYVPIVTFWIFTYHKIWILSIIFCFIWSYWIIYFLACL